MLGVVNPLGDLEIVVYHEVGHIVVTKLLRRTVGYIELEHNNQAGTWQGKVIKDESNDDSDWLSLDLDQYIPYDEFHPCSEARPCFITSL